MKRVRDIQWSGDRGEGKIFFFVDADTGRKVSQNLYLAYWAGGKEQLLSAKTDDLDDAKRELKRLTRNRENAREGREVLITPKTERVTVGELLDANIRRAEEKGLLSIKVMGYQTDILKALLGNVRAVTFRPEHVDQYRRRRLKGEGSQHGKKVGKTTIRHELEVLAAAFKHGVRIQLLRYAPYIEMPTEDNVRQQEIPLEDFPRILKAIEDEDGRDFVEWMLLTAMRPKGIAALQWSWFDAKTWTLKVPSQKGGIAREFSIEGSLREVIERRIGRRRLDSPFIFHAGGQQLDARRVRRMFYAALEACEMPVGRNGFTLYDTKKTALGLLIDSGLSEREAMHFSGHATPSMLDRYIVKNSRRHGENVQKRDVYMKKRLSEKEGGKPEKAAEVLSISRK